MKMLLRYNGHLPGIPPGAEERPGLPGGEKAAAEDPAIQQEAEKINREYSKKSKPFWEDKECEIGLPGCTGQAQCINHKRGKATVKRLMDEKDWGGLLFLLQQ